MINNKGALRVWRNVRLIMKFPPKNKERAYRQLGQQKENKKSQLHSQDNEADEGRQKADMYVGR